MRFQKVCTHDDIVVEGEFEETNGLRHWRPLRNFGWLEGHANEFKDIDCPKMEERQLKMLADRYRPEVKYYRVNGRTFKKQRQYENYQSNI